MATLFPDARVQRVIFSSRGEEKFYLACAQQLDDKWRVYSSCTLSGFEKGQGMKDNEIDFVLYHPKCGIIIIEVKGGRIEFDPNTSTFFSINRHDERFKIKNPFKQVLLWKSRFIRYIRKQNIQVPVCHAVCLPDVIESEIPNTAAIEPELVIGINRIGMLLETLQQIATQSHREQFLTFTDAWKEVDEVLKGSHFATKLHLRDYLDNHELRVKDIESITETLITPLANNHRMGIEGEAGTGKTILAIMLAKHFRNISKSVLLLSSNILMNNYLKQQIGSGVSVKTYHQLAQDFKINMNKEPEDFEGSHDDWVQFAAPERFAQAIQDSGKKVDVIICDEAQDVQPFWWDAIELLLSGEESHLYIFFDRSQGIFGSGGKEHHFEPEGVIPVDPPWFPLVHNYRTTREISGFARSFRTGKQILKSHSGRLGYKPQPIFYQNQSDFIHQMKALFRKLFEEEGIRPSEVCILSARAPFQSESVLNGVKAIGNYPLFDLAKLKKSKKPRPQGHVSVSTIESYKGLETPIAIITNIEEHRMPISNPIMMSLLYVAATRAKHMLFPFLKKNGSKKDYILEALKAVEEKGALILEGSSGDYRYTGEVTHYNPERVGWLRVDDPSFEKRGIMFFPIDAEKLQQPIKVGMKIRFRPQVEGTMSFASDLSVEQHIERAPKAEPANQKVDGQKKAS